MYIQEKEIDEIAIIDIIRFVFASPTNAPDKSLPRSTYNFLVLTVIFVVACHMRQVRLDTS